MDPKFEVTERKDLFQGDFLNIDGRDFDISKDGTKFLLLKNTDEDFDPHRLNVVANWFERLK